MYEFKKQCERELQRMDVRMKSKEHLAVIDSIRQRKTKIPADEMILQDIKKEHPELYFWDQTRYNLESSILGSFVYLNYVFTVSECKYIEQKADTIALTCNDNGEEKTVRKIHNYFIKNVSYDYNDDTGKPENHNAGGIFLYNKGVCEGISKAFQWLCHLCNIECTVIEGALAGGAHMWNIVTINGKNYHVDVTQDIAATDKSWNKPAYMYYLVTDAEIKQDHIFSENFNCVNTEANPFYKAGKVFRSENELRRYLKSIPRTERLIYFKYFGGLSKDNIIQIAAAELQSSLSMKENAGTYYLERNGL